MSEEKPSENLRDLESHAEEQGAARAEEAGEKPDDPDEVATATEATAEGEDPGEQMRPGGEAAHRIDEDRPMKRIDEDVQGGEETEDMTDVEAGDGEAPSS